MAVRNDGRRPAARDTWNSQGVTTESRGAHAHAEERGRGPMSDTSQGLLQRGSDAEGTDWRDHAACRDVDPDVFFPIGTSDASLPQIDEAKRICRTCPVCGPCLRWALGSGDAGVWGGTTEDERRNLRQLRSPLRDSGLLPSA
jgi:WhiB family redox-sensing transcriptional regulator